MHRSNPGQRGATSRSRLNLNYRRTEHGLSSPLHSSGAGRSPRSVFAVITAIMVALLVITGASFAFYMHQRSHPGSSIASTFSQYWSKRQNPADSIPSNVSSTAGAQPVEASPSSASSSPSWAFPSTSGMWTFFNSDTAGGSGGRGRFLTPQPPAVSPPPPPLTPLEAKKLERERLKLEAEGLSELATAEMRAKFGGLVDPNDPLYPYGGPVDHIDIQEPFVDQVPIMYGKYHVVVVTDTRAYNRWQMLVNYHSYLKAKAANPNGPMGGYTRLLHLGVHDDLLHIIPSVVVEALPRRADQWDKRMHRPWALTQWLTKVFVEEEYIFVAEPDHIFLRQVPMLASPTKIAAWPSWFVNCEDPQLAHMCTKWKYNPRKIPVSHIPRIGSAPSIIKKTTFAQIVPVWDRFTRDLHNDPEARGVQDKLIDSYAFALAVANALRGTSVEVEYHRELQVEPPYVKSLVVETCAGFKKQPNECPKGSKGVSTLRDAYMLHYKLSLDFDKDGKDTTDVQVGEYHFHKATYVDVFPTTPLPAPPPGAPETAHELIKWINEAAAAFPIWKVYEALDESTTPE